MSPLPLPLRVPVPDAPSGLDLDARDLADATSAGILVLDAHGAVVHANPAAAQLLGWPEGGPGPQAAALPPALGALGDEAMLRFEPRPGQVVEARRRSLPGAGAVVTLLDASLQAEAVQLAQRDPLTGLANRIDLRARLAERLASAESGGAAASLLCIDLDRFKAVNDTLGHPMGDALLRKVADRLRAGVRPGDVVARMGGDEFAVLQSEGARGAAPDGRDELSEDAAESLARRLVDLVGRPYAIEGHILNVGASIGIARVGRDGTDADELLKKADLALYRAKAEGRGTHRFFEPGMDADLQRRRALEFDLRKALALREFHLAFQPQVSAGTGTLKGFEALLRWHHPQRGRVSPADFIPLAEEIGLIVPIGEWVLATACREAVGWPTPLTIAVNVSPIQFRNGRLADRVAAALDASGLHPARLELEITEGALIDNTAVVLEALHSVRALGVRVSMDDFGTGYSSLAYLHRFPFDRIKIDQSFVRGGDQSGGDRAIVRAIASLGASLGMQTTAEGVETPEQLDRIRRDGCTEVQGYLTGRPLDPEGAAALAAAFARRTPSEEFPP